MSAGNDVRTLRSRSSISSRMSSISFCAIAPPCRSSSATRSTRLALLCSTSPTVRSRAPGVGSNSSAIASLRWASDSSREEGGRRADLSASEEVKSSVACAKFSVKVGFFRASLSAILQLVMRRTCAQGHRPVSRETSPRVRKHSASLKRASSPSILENNVRAASSTSHAALKSSSGASSMSSAAAASAPSARSVAAKPEPEPEATGCSSARWTCVESVEALLATAEKSQRV